MALRGANLENNVAARPQRLRVADHLHTRLRKSGIGKIRCGSGARFHRHGETQFLQLARHVRRGGYPFFSRVNFLGDPDLHAKGLQPWSRHRAAGPSPNRARCRDFDKHNVG